MRIILGFPMMDQQTGHYIKKAFEVLGHEIVAVNDPRNPLQGAQQLLTFVDKYKPDFVFLAKDVRYNTIIKELSKKVLTVMWNLDVRQDINIFLRANGPMYQYCHLKFTIGKSNLKEYRKMGVKNIYWLSEGISPEHHKTEELCSIDKLKYTADVAFAGSVKGLHSGRGELLELIKDQKDLNFLKWSNVFNHAHNKMCQCSSINLGHSGWPNVSLSMSARDYRIMGAGGFLLTNKVRDIEEWFELDKMCVVYTSPGECLEKIRYYLKHTEERCAIAKYGQKIVHEKHKFSDRLKEVIEYVQNFNGDNK